MGRAGFKQNTFHQASMEHERGLLWTTLVRARPMSGIHNVRVVCLWVSGRQYASAGIRDPKPQTLNPNTRLLNMIEGRFLK